MKQNIEIDLLFVEPILSKESLMELTPLAPLSMVSSLPGSYYKTEKTPTKLMLAGLFENILGWHFDDNLRKDIIKKIKSKRDILSWEKFDSGYQPLIYDQFEILNPIFIPAIKYYEDLWTQHLKAGDNRHAQGSTRIDWRIEQKLNILKKKIQKSEAKLSPDYDKFFKENRNQFPHYYRSVPKREFIITDGSYKIKIRFNSVFYEKLKQELIENNIGYLGTSEGWVNINLLEDINAKSLLQ